MPPPEEVTEKAIQCLLDTAITQFTATPSTTTPGKPATLNWKATSPAGCSVSLELNGTKVAKSGSKVVAPSATTVYRLAGRMLGQYSVFKSLTLNVDTSACTITTVAEDLIRPLVQSSVKQSIAGTPFTERAPAGVEVEPTGILIALKLRIAVPNFFDPDLNIRMTVRVATENGQPRAYFTQYSVSVDWPWWVSVITLGVAEFVESRIADVIESKSKPKLLEAIQSQLASAVGFVPAGMQLTSVETAANEVRIMICPK